MQTGRRGCWRESVGNGRGNGQASNESAAAIARYPCRYRGRTVFAKTSATMYSGQDERLDKNTGTCDNLRRRTCDNPRQRVGVLELGVTGHTRTAIAQRNS